MGLRSGEAEAWDVLGVVFSLLRRSVDLAGNDLVKRQLLVLMGTCKSMAAFALASLIKVLHFGCSWSHNWLDRHIGVELRFPDST